VAKLNSPLLPADSPTNNTSVRLATLPLLVGYVSMISHDSPIQKCCSLVVYADVLKVT
jgi:hypothetical protein